MHGSVLRAPPPLSTRKGQAYAYICEELTHGRRSPSLPEIGRHLKISTGRAHQLVNQLVAGGWISRSAGAQRSLHVPGLEIELAIALLRRSGIRVNEDALEEDPYKLFQLPKLPPLRHIPDDFIIGGEASGDDDNDRGRVEPGA